MPDESQYVWTIATSRDLLEKAKRDLARFRASHESNDGFQIDHAMNCAIALWHIHDWLWNEQEAKLKANGIVNKSEFQKFLKAKDGRDRLTLCERLANGSKHFSLNKPSHIDLKTYVSKVDVPDSMSRAAADRMAAGEKFVVYSLGIEDARDVLNFSTTDGKSIRVDNLFEATVNFWNEMFEECFKD